MPIKKYANDKPHYTLNWFQWYRSDSYEYSGAPCGQKKNFGVVRLCEHSLSL
ncbi:hypothetical protein PGB90_004420 [Kerria lacca]